MSDLRNRIVECLTNSFILDRAIDPTAVVLVIQKDYPGTTPEELDTVIRDIAKGIGVRIREPSNATSDENQSRDFCIPETRPEWLSD